MGPPVLEAIVERTQISGSNKAGQTLVAQGALERKQNGRQVAQELGCHHLARLLMELDIGEL